MALYGLVIMLIGFLFYLFGVLVAIPRRLIFMDNVFFQNINEMIVWYSGIPIFIGLTLLFTEILIIFPHRKRQLPSLKNSVIKNKLVTVVLTAYNDELAIGEAVKDFKEPLSL